MGHQSIQIKSDSDIMSKYSDQLFRLASIIELCVVVVGLSISLIAATQNMDTLSIAGMIIAGGPFAIVALTELTKIPLALMIFFSKWARPLYILLALFISAITFETLFNGFERNFSVLNLQIEQKKNEINQKHEKIEINKERITLLEKDMKEQTQAVEAKKALARKNTNAAIARMKRTMQLKAIDLTSYQKAKRQLQSELRELKKARMVKSNEFLAAKNDLYQTLQGNNDNKAQDSLNEERRDLRARLKSVNERMEKDVADASFLTKGSVRDEYNQRIQDLENKLQQLNVMALNASTGDVAKAKMANQQSQIDMLNEQYQMILDDMSRNIADKEAELKAVKKGIRRAQTALSKGIASKTSQAQASLKSQMNTLESQQDSLKQEFVSVKEQVQNIHDENSDIKEKISEDKFKLDELILSNQVYRMAAYIDDAPRATDIKKTTVGMVASIWFGSLALICSLTGISMAIASLHLRSLARSSRKEESE